MKQYDLWCPECDKEQSHELTSENVAECCVCREPHDLSDDEISQIKKSNHIVTKRCPNCSGVLFKKPKQAEGVSTCKSCGNVWLIILVKENR